jgi:hypothetical protein
VRINHPIAIQSLIVAAMIGLCLLISVTVPKTTRVNADAWLRDLTPKADAELEKFTQVQATESERTRLKGQLDLVRKRARHHLSVAVYFFSNYYMAILESFVMGGIAAVALLFITIKS